MLITSVMRQEIIKTLLEPYKTLTFPQLVRAAGVSGDNLLLFIQVLYELVERGHVLACGDRYMRMTLKKAEGF